MENDMKTGVIGSSPRQSGILATRINGLAQPLVIIGFSCWEVGIHQYSRITFSKSFKHSAGILRFGILALGLSPR